MRIRFTPSRVLQISLWLCCLSLATDAVAQQSGPGVLPGSRNPTAAAAPFFVSRVNLVTVSTDGIVTQNLTPATVGVPVQISPRNRQSGTAWDTDDAVSRTASFFAEVLPTSGATVGGSWKLGYIDPVTGAVTYPMTVTSDGMATVPSNLYVGASFFLIQGGVLYAAADGKWSFSNIAQNSGIGLDFTLNDVLKVRTQAQTGDASLTALALGGAGTGTSVANVGANSCGTTAATIAGNQVSGVITVGTIAGTQCRVTFSTAAPVARDCTVTDSTTTIATRATAVSTTTHDFLGAFVAGDQVTYICTVR